MSSTIGIGANNNFIANGGNIFLFAKGSISGTTGNAFHARSVGNTTTAATKAASSGGGIEIGSGLINSTNLLAALATHQGSLPAFPPTSALGNGTVVINNNPQSGVIKVNFPGSPIFGPVNLNNGGATATLDLNFPPLAGPPVAGNNGGAQVFDALGGTTVKFDGGTFQTEALKPIGMVSTLEAEEDNLTTLPVILQSAGPGTTSVSVGNCNAELHLFSLADGGSIVASTEQNTMPSKFVGKLSAQIYAKPKTRFLNTAPGSLFLTSGEIFVNTYAPVEVRTEFAEIQASKGALASVKSIQGCTYIRSCSGMGIVSVKVGGKSIELNPGEEVLVTNHKPDETEIHPSDGLGRRLSHSIAVGPHFITVSEFAIITMLSNSDSLAGGVHSNAAANKRLVDRLLKTAATVDVVLKYKGAYTAK